VRSCWRPDAIRAWPRPEGSRALERSPSASASAARAASTRCYPEPLHVPRERGSFFLRFLERVEKPSRYVGGEHGEVRKDWDTCLGKLCLAFPDVYDIGMSHLGFKILYGIVNGHPKLARRALLRAVGRHGARAPRARGAAALARDVATAPRLRRGRLLAPVRAHLHQRAPHARARRHPAPHADRSEDDPLVVAVGRWPPTPSPSRRSTTAP
jgi:hypothetical protein